MKRPILRVDGWTEARRAVFLAAIVGRASVAGAAAAAGMSRESVYRLRRRDPEFAALWADALAVVAASDRAHGADLLAIVDEAAGRDNPAITARAHLSPHLFDRWLIRSLSGMRARAATTGYDL